MYINRSYFYNIMQFFLLARQFFYMLQSNMTRWVIGMCVFFSLIYEWVTNNRTMYEWLQLSYFEYMNGYSFLLRKWALAQLSIFQTTEEVMQMFEAYQVLQWVQGNALMGGFGLQNPVVRRVVRTNLDIHFCFSISFHFLNRSTAQQQL